MLVFRSLFLSSHHKKQEGQHNQHFELELLMEVRYNQITLLQFYNELLLFTIYQVQHSAKKECILTLSY